MIQNDIIRLIVIEESANDAEVILNSLRKARYPIRPTHVEDDEDLATALNEHEWDLIIAVPVVGELTAEQVCEMVQQAKLDIPVIVLMSKMDNKMMALLYQAGVRNVLPNNNDVALQSVVGLELENLAERRRRKHLEQLYRESQRHNIMLLQSSRDAIAYVHDGMHIHANPSYLEMFGYKTMDDLEGMPVMDLVSLEDQPKFKDFMREYMMEDKEEEQEISLEGVKSNNKRFKLKMEVSKAIYDSERCIQIVIRDQSQNQELERQLREVSRRDLLTNLFNRQYFIAILEKALAKVMESNVRSILLYVVLDILENNRENLGVSADPLLRNVAAILGKLGEHATVARFGDNVFTLLLLDKDIPYATQLAETICKKVEATVTELGTQSVITTCSIGIAPVMASSGSVHDVLADAHTACRKVLQRGGNGHEVYKAVVKTSEQGGTGSRDIAKMIETAIEENRFSLRYQPVVSLHGGTLPIYEVFLRMTDSEGQFVPAGQLFAAAEEANLTIHLDKWVLKESFKVLMKEQQENKHTTFLVKLTDQALKDENVLLFIRRLLKSTQLPGERLVFEISEAVAISQVKLAKAFITTVNTMGCKTALEHFGTELNSSSTLKHIPVDYVKIDSSFSRGLSANPDNQKAVQEITKLAHDSGKQTIAEAVEDVNSLTVLWQCGVDFAQGNYIQSPLEEPSYHFEDEE
ncbi:EAL domain-containing response regulator [Thioflexithrix psekupsensis]|uniref:Diguanylate cyclase n=1 Tax=Thioflexithrix psekupsensis TaxID=1570016 RepID=A0A251XAM5_9GAMM|nr:EAL domain-containing protein [Thioflexithrix psekupsensis]OUD15481.1 hypothetical protein TPSD3_02845 [Thioflexithrix psekupsensis]